MPRYTICNSFEATKVIMKLRTLVFLATLLISLLTNAQQTITLQGRLEFYPLKKIYLYGFPNGNKELVDSFAYDAVKGFSVKKAFKQGVYLISDNRNHFANFVIGKEDKVELTGTYSSLKEGYISTVNSPENDLYFKITKYYLNSKAVEDSIDAIGASIYRMDPKFETKTNRLKDNLKRNYIQRNFDIRNAIEKMPASYVAQVIAPFYLYPVKEENPTYDNEFDNVRSFMHFHYFDYINFADPRILQTGLLIEKYKDYTLAFIVPDLQGNMAAVDNIINLAKVNDDTKNYTINALIKIYSEDNFAPIVEYIYTQYFVGSGCESTATPDVKKTLEGLKNIAPGNKAPDIRAVNIKGDSVALYNIKGPKYIMLLYWASWCSHCEEAMPFVRDMYERYKTKGFEIFAVSVDADKTAWVTKVKQNGLPWINVCDFKEWKTPSVDYFNVKATPSFVLLDADYRVVKKMYNFNDMKTTLEQKLP